MLAVASFPIFLCSCLSVMPPEGGPKYIKQQDSIIMAQLKEILEREKQRSDDAQCRIVHLFPEGTFYRAYEWSAWLCSRYISQFKPTRRQLKNSEDTIVFVGFPTASLPKFVPEGTAAKVNEDKSVELTIPQSLLPDIQQQEPFLTDFDNWKQSVPLAETKKKSGSPAGLDEFAVQPSNARELLKKLLAYPIEQKTPIDSMLFLTELRREAVTMI